MNVAVGVCEGDELSPEKRPIILKAQKVWITYKGKLPGRITGSLKTPPTALQSEKDDIESRIEKLWMLMPSEDEKNVAMSSLRRFTIIALKLLAGIL